MHGLGGMAIVLALEVTFLLGHKRGEGRGNVPSDGGGDLGPCLHRDRNRVGPSRHHRQQRESGREARQRGHDSALHPFPPKTTPSSNSPYRLSRHTLQERTHLVL